MISQFKWRPIYIAYGLIGLSLIALLFSGRYDARFVKWLTDIGLDTAVPGITITKIVFTILDISMMVVIMLPLKDEDERVDKIRSYATKTTFQMSIGFVITLGFYSVKTDVLLLVAIIMAYYFLLFYLSLYRDAGIVYMSKEELEAYDKTLTKRFEVYYYIQGAIAGAGIGICTSAFHRPDIIGVVVVANAAIWVLAKTVYISWKS
jgi:hypothetical protein